MMSETGGDPDLPPTCRRAASSAPITIRLAASCSDPIGGLRGPCRDPGATTRSGQAPRRARSTPGDDVSIAGTAGSDHGHAANGTRTAGSPRGRALAVTAEPSRRSVTAARRNAQVSDTPPVVRPDARRRLPGIPSRRDANASSGTGNTPTGRCRRGDARDNGDQHAADPDDAGLRGTGAGCADNRGGPEASVATPATDVGQHSSRRRAHATTRIVRQARAAAAPSNGSARPRGTASSVAMTAKTSSSITYSAIANPGFRTLTQGQAVEYEVQQSANGLHAVSVRRWVHRRRARPGRLDRVPVPHRVPDRTTACRVRAGRHCAISLTPSIQARPAQVRIAAKSTGSTNRRARAVHRRSVSAGQRVAS